MTSSLPTVIVQHAGKGTKYCLLTGIIAVGSVIFILQLQSYAVLSHPTNRFVNKIDGSGTSNATTDVLLQTKKPFFIGTGPGTTGTRSMFATMCRLGFPSVHYRSVCAPFEDLANTKAQQSYLLEGVQAHGRVKENFLWLKNCSRTARQRNENVCPTYNITFSKLLKDVETVVKSDIMFVSDVPYPFLVDYIQKIASEAGFLDIVIMTERDPMQWSQSRMDHHEQNGDIGCKHVEYAFNLQKCYAQENGNPAKLLYGLSEWTKTSDGSSSSSVGVDCLKVFHRYLKDSFSRIIHFNLWNEALSNGTQLEDSLLRRMKHWVSTETLSSYHSKASRFSRLHVKDALLHLT